VIDNQIARRVAIHQAVDRIVEARQEMGDNGPAEALSDALGHLSVVPLCAPSSRDVENAWRAVAAVAQGQLEEALEARAG
jgi:hypothetical protein